MENIVNSRELLLLCAIRKGLVFAENLSTYGWTYRHYSFVQQKVLGIKFGEESYSQVVRDAKDEARSIFPIQEPELRKFYLREGDIGYTLCDHDKDLSWYDIHISPVQEDLPDWVYKANFKLKTPMSQQEEFIVRNYGKFS